MNFDKDSFIAGVITGRRLRGRKGKEKPKPEVRYFAFIGTNTSIPTNRLQLYAGGHTKNWNGVLEYSLDGENWIEWDGDTIESNSDTNYTIQLRGFNNTVISGAINKGFCAKFPSGGIIECKGNIETLLDYHAVSRGEHPFMDPYCFTYLFTPSRQELVSAPELPAMTLSSHCYDHMFYSCSKLRVAPELPATILDDSCYSRMFAGCTSLITPPSVLPAKIVGPDVYYSMFFQCSSLTTCPKILGKVFLQNSCHQMFRDCNSLRTLPKLFPLQVERACFNFMFWNCNNIKVSDIKIDEYQNEWRIPMEGQLINPPSDWNGAMLLGTTGTFIGAPAANVTYYTSNEVV